MPFKIHNHYSVGWIYIGSYGYVFCVPLLSVSVFLFSLPCLWTMSFVLNIIAFWVWLPEFPGWDPGSLHVEGRSHPFPLKWCLSSPLSGKACGQLCSLPLVTLHGCLS